MRAQSGSSRPLMDLQGPQRIRFDYRQNMSPWLARGLVNLCEAQGGTSAVARHSWQIWTQAVALRPQPASHGAIMTLQSAVGPRRLSNFAGMACSDTVSVIIARGVWSPAAMISAVYWKSRFS